MASAKLPFQIALEQWRTTSSTSSIPRTTTREANEEGLACLVGYRYAGGGSRTLDRRLLRRAGRGDQRQRAEDIKQLKWYQSVGW